MPLEADEAQPCAFLEREERGSCQTDPHSQQRGGDELTARGSQPAAGPALAQRRRASSLLIPDRGFAHVQTRAARSSCSAAVLLSAAGLTPA